jgi:hypothetical protein
MTAYLQPGDKIHLAFGVDSDLPYGDKVKQASENAQALTAQYAFQGIEVVMWTANSQLTHPVVVSVIRPFQPLKLPETRD